MLTDIRHRLFFFFPFPLRVHDPVSRATSPSCPFLRPPLPTFYFRPFFGGQFFFFLSSDGIKIDRPSWCSFPYVPIWRFWLDEGQFVFRRISFFFNIPFPSFQFPAIFFNLCDIFPCSFVTFAPQQCGCSDLLTHLPQNQLSSLSSHPQKHYKTSDPSFCTFSSISVLSVLQVYSYSKLTILPLTCSPRTVPGSAVSAYFASWDWTNVLHLLDFKVHYYSCMLWRAPLSPTFLRTRIKSEHYFGPPLVHCNLRQTVSSSLDWSAFAFRPFLRSECIINITCVVVL